MPHFDRSNGGAAALKIAVDNLTGKPYVYGGTYPEDGGTDCDGAWSYAYGQIGVTVRRPTELGFLDDPWDQRNGHRDDPWEPGDLGWIAGSDGTPTSPGHVWGYVSPGRIFQAEETGTVIGEFDYDTSVFDFRTRPALQLPLPAPPKPNPGSPASRIHWPTGCVGDPPILTPGRHNPAAWVVAWRYCLRAAGFWPRLVPCVGLAYGPFTQRQTKKLKAARHLSTDAIVGAECWADVGVPE